VKKLPNLLLWALLTSLAAANVLLIRQNLQMRRDLGKYQPHALKGGDKVPPFSATAADGSPFEVSYTGQGRKRVLLYFTPTCPYCRQQFAYWREMLERIDGNSFEVIGVVSQAEDKARLQDYLASMGCAPASRAPLRVALVPDAVRDQYMLNSTPVTLLVDNNGTVEQAWVGKWADKDATTAGSLLGLTFSSSSPV
jgi:peroxiredoxin